MRGAGLRGDLEHHQRWRGGVSRKRIGKVDQMSESKLVTMKRQIQVLYAFLMHDIKARFFGHGAGYAMTMMWPLVHILTIVAIYSLSSRVPPNGSSLALFATCGVLPFMYVTYVSRFMILGVMSNKAFLQYPIIKVMDILTARALLELISMSIVTVVIFIGLASVGIDWEPQSYTQAA